MKQTLRNAILFVSLCVIGFSILVFMRIPAARISEVESAPTKEETISDTTLSAVYKDLIEIYAPLPNSVIAVTSPQTSISVTGVARGMWFFEASFPVQLLNADGVEIASGVAQAGGEWMTESYVPFSVTLMVPATALTPGTVGMLVLKKDNPSGEAENDDAFMVPVQF